MIDGKQFRSNAARRRVRVRRLLPAGHASTSSSTSILLCAFDSAAFWAARPPPSVAAQREIRGDAEW